MAIAAPLHPAWERCSPAVRKLHARNVAILLMGERPVDACVAWSERGEAVGGTGMGIRIAETRGIPVLNLESMVPVCERLHELRRSGVAEGEMSASRASVRQGGGSGSPAPLPGKAQGECTMVLPSFEFDVDMLAAIGIHPAAVREVIAEDRALRCADREAVFPERCILFPASGSSRRWRRA